MEQPTTETTYSCETLQDLAIFVDSSKNMHDIDFLATLRKFFPKFAMKVENKTGMVVFEGQEPPEFTPGRVLLKSSFPHPISGTIIDVESRKILAVQPPTPLPVNTFPANVEIFPVLDGTTVTLYFYEGKWAIATHSGYDVTGFMWIGLSTYKTALTAALARYPEFSFDALCKNCCYTIGFREHNFHPLLADPIAAWLVQKVDVSLLGTNTDAPHIDRRANIGLPLQKPIMITEDEINTACETSLDTFLKHPKKESICYGFIAMKPDGTVLLKESRLRQEIRKHMYNVPREIPGARTRITPQARLAYIVLRAYLLDSKKTSIFLQMFPQFSAKFKAYDLFFARLLTAIIVNATVGQVPVDKNIEALVAYFSDTFGRMNINWNNRDTRSIIGDIVVNPDNLELLFPVIELRV